ncbi:MAG: hypothetical protein MI924_32945 [Chloroflexales bacterium]|nr:hypothetical protein [Chloroflexales bacterium]
MIQLDPLWFFVASLVVLSAPPVLILLGRIGGWAILAQRYRVSSPTPASVTRGVSGRVGSLSYRNNLVVGIDDHGLYLAPMLPFRLGHAPLRISWSAFQAQQRPTAEPAQVPVDDPRRRHGTGAAPRMGAGTGPSVAAGAQSGPLDTSISWRLILLMLGVMTVQLMLIGVFLAVW